MEVVEIDGGKGQLSAVMEALRTVGRQHIARTCFVALAKQREELYVPAATQPLLVAGVWMCVCICAYHVQAIRAHWHSATKV